MSDAAIVLAAPNLLDAIVPAAGIGSRMQSDIPKQYLQIAGRSILEHTLATLLECPEIGQVIVVLHPDDLTFAALPIAKNARIITVIGGDERADSVLSGLKVATTEFALVHDAARPCLSQFDLVNLIKVGRQHPVGAILGSQVRDTMKRCNELGEITQTVSREKLWHALTPQLFKTKELMMAITTALKQQWPITDEASAMEKIGLSPLMVAGSSSNIKVTRPEDLKQAKQFLQTDNSPQGALRR